MGRILLIVSLFSAAALWVLGSVTTASDKRSPVIVELFTSEGCSSCPPADALLIQLEKSQPVPNAEIIVLGQHVDYWNRLGWTDPFSSELFSQRQSEYADAFGREGVYTPQMVVNGEDEFVGNDASRARSAIAQAAGRPKAPLTVSLVETGRPELLRVRVQIGLAPREVVAKDAEVFLAITESNLASSVVRGENAGRNLQHTGVVRLLKALGRAAAPSSLDAEAKLLPQWHRQNLSAIVFLQDKKTHRILGAATTHFSTR